MRRGRCSIQGSTTKSASSSSVSRPDPRTGAVTSARGRGCGKGSSSVPGGGCVRRGVHNGAMMTGVSGSVTVGIDIGTTATKAVAADADGRVLARARVKHRVLTPLPDQLEHDAAKAWRRGPLQALAEVTASVAEPAGVCVASMVPSLAAVDARGRPVTPGLLYGDGR